MSKILVIGATSLVGQRLYAHPGPSAATFTARKPQREGEVRLDLTQPEAFVGQGYTEVIMTAPIWHLTDEVLTMLWAQGMKRIVVFSSTSRFSKTASPQPEEREVAERLKHAEDRLIAFCPMHDVRWTILRPTLIWDEGRDRNVSRIRQIMDRFGVFPICGQARGLRQPVHARDLAAAAMAALYAPAAQDRAYDLSGGETLTYADMVRRIGKAGHRKAGRLSVPAPVWELAFAALSLIRPGQALKSNLEMARRMNVDLVFSHDEARRDFGYAPGPFAPDFTASAKA